MCLTIEWKWLNPKAWESRKFHHGEALLSFKVLPNILLGLFTWQIKAKPFAELDELAHSNDNSGFDVNLRQITAQIRRSQQLLWISQKRHAPWLGWLSPSWAEHSVHCKNHSCFWRDKHWPICFSTVLATVGNGLWTTRWHYARNSRLTDNLFTFLIIFWKGLWWRRGEWRGCSTELMAPLPITHRLAEFVPCVSLVCLTKEIANSVTQTLMKLKKETTNLVCYCTDRPKRAPAAACMLNLIFCFKACYLKASSEV